MSFGELVGSTTDTSDQSNAPAVTDLTSGGGVANPFTVRPSARSTSIVRLRDVATIEMGAQNYNQSCKFDGQPSVGLMIYQLPGTNALEVADAVRAKMEELKARFPDGVDYIIGYDTTPYIRESINDVVFTLFEAVALVAAVVLLFLQDWRAMILPLIDVPVSIIGTFAVMSAFGFSLNNISLFGLVLAIGIVVDDAIVVLENIERLMAGGLDARAATIKAMDEVTGPIVAVALVLCAVFVPCAFISGITGKFFHQFAVTIAVSTVISAINAVTMTPSRAVLIFKSEKREEGTHELKHEALPWWFFGLVAGGLLAWLGPRYFDIAGFAAAHGFHMPGGLVRVAWAAPGLVAGGLVGRLIIRPVNFVLGAFFRAFNRAFDRMTRGYAWTVGVGLRLNPVVLAVYAALLGLTYWTFTKAPMGFIPQQDQGRLIVNIQLPDGASLERTERVIAKVTEIAQRTEGVQHIVSTAGMSFVARASSPNFASMFIVLNPFDQRQRPDLKDTAIMGRLNRQWAKEINDGMVSAFPSSAMPGLGAAGGFKLEVEDRGGTDLRDLQAQVDNLTRKLREAPGVNTATTQFRSKSPQLFLEVDRTKAAALGVPLNDVSQTLHLYLGSLYVNSFNEFGRHWQVTVQADGKYRTRPDSINLFQVRNKDGQMVPLGTLLTRTDIGGPIAVERYNLYTAASISGSVKPGYSDGEVIKTIEKVAGETLPLSMRIEWTELMFLQLRAGNTGYYVFLLAIFTVFLALSALYESWGLPLAVILVVPLCLLCSLAGTSWTGRDVNIFVQIGLLVLVGLACKNAILIVEYAKQMHLEGKPLFEATKVASRLRLRPILMTSLAFIFGVVPLVVATGAGAEMRRSLGVAVFSGMIGVTLFGIFLTPVFFYVIQGLGESRLFKSEWSRRVVRVVAGGALGGGAGFLLDRIGVARMPWSAVVGAVAGIVIAVAAAEIHRRVAPMLATNGGKRS
jgi:multidrug efflux pump